MWKEISLSFSRPLSDSEERILIAYFKTMTETIKEKIKMGRDIYKNPLMSQASKLTGMGGASEVVKMQFQFVLDNLYQYARLEKETSQLYRFMVKENALTIRAPLGQTINLWERMKRKFNLKFKLELCRKIGLMPGDLKIEFNETPKEPEGESSS